LDLFVLNTMVWILLISFQSELHMSFCLFHFKFTLMDELSDLKTASYEYLAKLDLT
jgi:hypothetical protein